MEDFIGKKTQRRYQKIAALMFKRSSTPIQADHEIILSSPERA